MAIALNCPNSHIGPLGKPKKCGQVEPYLDPKTDKVYCPSCDQELTNISHFTKNTLRQLKQYRVKSMTPFSVKCSSCSKEDRPKLLSNGDIICPNCNKPHDHLSEAFKTMLRDQLKKSNDIGGQ
jgi:uncharacterized Zn finger protein (UPF0148 family)